MLLGLVKIGATIAHMATVGVLLLKALIPLFFLGMAGSAVVIVVSFIEDMKELLEEED